MAKDKIHYAVKTALENDGWQVTDDPLVLFFDDSVAIDLGAEKLIIAERGIEKIAVEIKTFNLPSVLYMSFIVLLVNILTTKQPYWKPMKTENYM